MIINIHAYVGESLLGEKASLDQLFQDMEESGVDKTVICSVKTEDSSFREENKKIGELVKEYPSRLAGFARVDPHLGTKSLDLLRACIEDYGMKGLLLHPWEETFAINDDIVYPFAEMCLHYKIPLMVETGYPWVSHCFQVGALAGDFPELKVIMTHGGQFDSSGYALTDVDYVMNKYSNLYIETSGDFSDEGLENIPVRNGEDRVLFGTHFPWLSTKMEIYRINRANLTDEQRERIFWKNAAEMLDL